MWVSPAWQVPLSRAADETYFLQGTELSTWTAPTQQQHLSYCLGGPNYLISLNISKYLEIFNYYTAHNPGEDEGLRVTGRKCSQFPFIEIKFQLKLKLYHLFTNAMGGSCFALISPSLFPTVMGEIKSYRK